MMQPKVTTSSQPDATPAATDELLALVETARTNTLSARHIADEIENTDEVNLADIVTIARRCSAALTAITKLQTILTGENEPTPAEQAVAALPMSLTLVNGRAAA